MEPTVTPQQCCPYCSHTFNRASDLKQEPTPREGDFSVCIYCAGLLVFNADLSVRKPTEYERDIANKSESVFNTQLMVRRLRKIGITIPEVGHA